MMIKKIILIVSFAFLSLSCAKTCFDKNEKQIFSVFEYKDISFNALMDELLKADVIIFGENHTSEFDHCMEERIYKSLTKKSKATLALEMFDRDVQSYINSYVENKISAEEFLENSRPWSNYSESYRNLVEHAKSTENKVLAANIPKTIASLVSKHGDDSLKSASGIGELFVKPYSTAEEYKERFFDFFLKMKDKTPMADFSKENLFMAQLLKDATMAFAINSEISKNPGVKIFFVCGSFHSDYYQGLYQQLLSANKDIVVKTISVSYDESDFDPLKSDFIILKWRI